MSEKTSAQVRSAFLDYFAKHGHAVQKSASLYYQDVAGGWLGSLARRVAKWSQ